MKAAYIKRYGKIEDVQLDVQPEPSITENAVLVKVHAASINPLDLRVLEGEFKAILPIKFPFILGNDFAGTVAQVGSNVTQFKVGDEVYAKTDLNGAFAEYTVVQQASLALKPKNIPMEHAASLPLVSLTAWQALVEIAKVKSGQKVLIHAGSGGVGSIAIQLAKHLGATVATTTSGKNTRWVRELGADIIIDYKTMDFEQELKDYDVVLDTQGGKTLEKSLSVIKRGGRIISISGPPDRAFAEAIKANWLLKFIIPLLSWSIRNKAKKRDITYSFLFMQPNGQQLSQISHLVETGKIKPVVDTEYNFSKIKEALEYVNTGRAKGKIILKIAD
ncbi:NADP-dependent oxidoreductase [Acinetobacter sp. NIPH 1958]|jgi:2-desacetyl-2-hydroxyethyl bacteriochlorophyllide A dehydrogenase|uniref:Zinc-containing alcohol dehydrogenase n=4 Tax=Acinetobacter TaxID=469 RepID=S7WSV5_ACIJU|nr:MULTISPECIES: NADP-dependent oxidoreductase [Acinetobacter]EEY92947.1 GroES-like protein [Acinetobacter junii SH205]ENV51852.1 chlorophyll synthesis pathway protein BchC [Acinetobacter junii CIP 107470 = MTCC 11364]EPR86226.1 zinc-containing alcohol dehydrogenase [Acinetobacter junii CIP 107470 = MTCC 11364]MCH7355204.1 NADP-dependent oxidoreductase [Acinetobacter sp. NIPH 1958]MDH0718416.1 NADP-dependent oxidoreductase [Acinetobacter junii]